MTRREALRTAFFRSLPIACSYLFISLAYGISIAEKGFPWYFSGAISLGVYTGAFQFVLIPMLAGGESITAIAVTALLMNARQVFYSLTFLPDFSKMGRRKIFMIHSLTDETYAVNCSLGLPQGEKQEVMFWIALLSWLYWFLGTVLGGLLGQNLPFDLTGIDFSMTALFIVLFLEQWHSAPGKLPGVMGLGVGVGCLLLLGSGNFMLPALLLISGILLVTGGNRHD